MRLTETQIKKLLDSLEQYIIAIIRNENDSSVEDYMAKMYRREEVKKVIMELVK